MGGCAMFGCTNRDSKGFRMFNFPSNKERRKIWELNCKRKNFVASTKQQICEVSKYKCCVHLLNFQYLTIGCAFGTGTFPRRSVWEPPSWWATDVEVERSSLESWWRSKVYERVVLRDIVNSQLGQQRDILSSSPVCDSEVHIIKIWVHSSFSNTVVNVHGELQS